MSEIKAVTFEYTREPIGMGAAPVVKVRIACNEEGGARPEGYGVETTGDKGHIPSLAEINDAKDKAHVIFMVQPYMKGMKGKKGKTPEFRSASQILTGMGIPEEPKVGESYWEKDNNEK